jgi:hypothetical protein
MADVQIQQTPDSSYGWVWAVVVIVLIALIAWFVFAGPMRSESRTTIEVETPAAGSPPAGGGQQTPPPNP